MSIAVMVSSFYNFNGGQCDEVVVSTCSTDGLCISLEVESFFSSIGIIKLPVSPE